MNKEQIRAALARHEKKTITRPDLASAAVLIPVFCVQQQCSVVLAKRSEEVHFHKGQFCFPGGGRCAEDRDLYATALRESQEEIGLRPQDVELLGQLDDQVTTSGYIMSPFVGYVPFPYNFVADGREIRKVITVPLNILQDAGHWRREDQDVEGQPRHLYFIEYEGDVIWGATARVLKQFVEVITEKSGAPGNRPRA